MPQGVPTIMAAVHPIEILQTPQQLVVLAEFLTQTRRIYLNEKMPALEDVSPGLQRLLGGHWQGDTLVVQTIGVREDVRFVDISPLAADEGDRAVAAHGAESSRKPAHHRRSGQFSRSLIRSRSATSETPSTGSLEYICDNNRYSVDAQGGSSLQVAPK